MRTALSLNLPLFLPRCSISLSKRIICHRPLNPVLKTLAAPTLISSKSRLFSSSAASGDGSGAARCISGGEVHVILGPMFAGKTTALIERIQLETRQGRKVAIIKSDKDVRYGLDSIVSHDGVRMPCWALPKLSIFPSAIGVQAYAELDVIGIDEAQFFTDLYGFCSKAADHDGKVVVVAGLDGDYLRRRFGSVLDIVPLADSVTKLTARCELCGQRAFFTLRKTADMATELIGGADVYMPVCRRHYTKGYVPSTDSGKVLLDPQELKA